MNEDKVTTELDESKGNIILYNQSLIGSFFYRFKLDILKCLRNSMNQIAGYQA